MKRRGGWFLRNLSSYTTNSVKRIMYKFNYIKYNYIHKYKCKKSRFSQVNFLAVSGNSSLNFSNQIAQGLKCEAVSDGYKTAKVLL